MLSTLSRGEGLHGRLAETKTGNGSTETWHESKVAHKAISNAVRNAMEAEASNWGSEYGSDYASDWQDDGNQREKVIEP